MEKTVRMSPVSRREFGRSLGLGLLAGASACLFPGLASADARLLDEAIKKVVGNKSLKPGKIKLDLPQIAENGNTVPVTVSVDSPMTSNNHVKAVHLFADKNPRPEVATLHFSPSSGKASASTRMRMIKTQNVVAVAELSDGTVHMSKAEVKVTIGGCGG